MITRRSGNALALGGTDPRSPAEEPRNSRVISYYETMTSRPTWAGLMERVGVSRASVARYLRTLREWGLVGLVASGRTAPYASQPEDGSERTNEAAVYVVCIPAPLAAVDAAADAVDKTETPPAQGGSHLKRERNPPHAHEEKHQKDTATPRDPSLGEALAGLARLTTDENRQLTLWPIHRTPATTMTRRAAAAEVRHRVPALSCLSVRDIAAVLRPFFIAGWCASDVLHALDWRPDGIRWPHDGAPTWTDPSRVRGWVRYRLAGWTRDGEPLRSPEQRKQAIRTEQALERRRVLEKQAQRAALVSADSAPLPWRIRLAQHGYEAPAKINAAAP